MTFVSQNQVSNLYVLFLTDGQDANRAGTMDLSQQLKELLARRDIFSWFNVIGMGDGLDGEFLASLVNTGTQAGNMLLVSEEQIEQGQLGEVTEIFEKSLEKDDKVMGMTYTLPDNT